MNYYPFGAEFCDNSTKSYVQNHKYNGKEFDNMHGLNTYDYGARQYNPVTGRWDRMDPHCEKYYNISPYNYCHNSPINRVDLDGNDDYFSNTGRFLYTKGSGANIYIQQGKDFSNFSNFDLRNSSNRQMAANVVGYYAKSVGIKSRMNGGKGNVGVSTLKQTNSEDGRVLAATTPEGDIYVKMTNGSLDEFMYNIYQLKSTLIHEKEHKEDKEKGIEKSSNLRHAQIVMTEMQNPDFDKCTSEYKEGQIRQFDHYYRKALHEKANMDQQSLDIMNQLRVLIRIIKQKQQ